MISHEMSIEKVSPEKNAVPLATLDRRGSFLFHVLCDPLNVFFQGMSASFGATHDLRVCEACALPRLWMPVDGYVDWS
jgi:hypothetical protein